MITLKLGADVISHLLPHRRPFLFLDGIEGFERAPSPTLTGFKHVSASEPVFEGHFPGLSLWPGVYTVEGLGQTANALLVILAIVQGFERHERTEAEALDALRAIDARARFGGRAPTEIERRVIESLGEPKTRMGMAGALEMKLIEPVFAGDTIRYRVAQSRALSNARRFDVEASVGERPVARGTMTSALPPGFLT